MSSAVLAAGVTAAAVCAFAIVRRRRRARHYAAIVERLRDERWVGIEDDLPPDQLDPEDLQWRPRIGSSLAGPEDLEEPVELDFSEFDETDVATAAVTVDMIGGEAEEGMPIDAGTGGGEPIKNRPARSDTPRPSTRPRQPDDFDWLDELDDPSLPPHRYR